MIALDAATQRASRREQMLLAYYLVKRSGAHALRKWLRVGGRVIMFGQAAP
jgi:hypothetical protein